MTVLEAMWGWVMFSVAVSPLILVFIYLSSKLIGFGYHAGKANFERYRGQKHGEGKA